MRCRQGRGQTSHIKNRVQQDKSDWCDSNKTDRLPNTHFSGLVQNHDGQVDAIIAQNMNKKAWEIAAAPIKHKSQT